MPQPSPRNLNLWKRGLGKVPESVWEETELETLVLADNGLTEVSESIGRLKKLRMLDLGHNRLAAVPDELGELPSLTDYLYLHDNRLTELPTSLGHLTRLRYLNIGESLFAKGGEDWSKWDDRITANLVKVQNEEGSWSGAHCITGRTFCTSAALLVLTLGGDNAPIASRLPRR